MVTTEVIRKSPQKGALQILVPLLDKESILTPGITDSHKNAIYLNKSSAFTFNIVQLMVLFTTLSALIALVYSLPQGLLSTPNMYIDGNSSGPHLFNWYQDQSDGPLINGWVISVPLWCYRVVMLGWSLWLAVMLPQWGKWG